MIDEIIKEMYGELCAMPKAKRTVLCTLLNRETVSWDAIIEWMKVDPEAHERIRDAYLGELEESNKKGRINK